MKETGPQFLSTALVLATLLVAPAPRAQPRPHVTAGAATLPGGGTAPAPARTVVTAAQAEMGAYADSDAVTVFTPAASAVIRSDTEGWSARGGYLADVVSAASVDIVSTASPRWTEVRHAGNVGALHKPGTIGGGLDASVSREPDYLSLRAGGRLLLELVDRTVNPVLAYSYTHDTAGRRGTPFSVYSQELSRHTLNAGVELLIDPATLLFVEVDALLESGDQKKPYRYLPVFDPLVAPSIPAGASLALVNQRRLPGRMSERTPLTRHRFAASARLARRYRRTTFAISERLYADDWGLLATTSEARVSLDLSRRFLGWLRLRMHLQSGVSFWERAYSAGVEDGVVAGPEYRTGDRELSPMIAGTAGLGLRWNLGAAHRPESWGLVFQTDTIATHFSDAIYIANRFGQLFVLQFEAEL